MLLRYSSLLVDTIPSHRDHQVSLRKERAHYRKKLLAVMDKLETLKPGLHCLNELNKDEGGAQICQLDVETRTSYSSEVSPLERSSVNSRTSSSLTNKQPVKRMDDHLRLARENTAKS